MSLKSSYFDKLKKDRPGIYSIKGYSFTIEHFYEITPLYLALQALLNNDKIAEEILIAIDAVVTDADDNIIWPVQE